MVSHWMSVCPSISLSHICQVHSEVSICIDVCLFHHCGVKNWCCGVKNCVVGGKSVVGVKKIKGRSKG